VESSQKRQFLSGLTLLIIFVAVTGAAAMILNRADNSTAGHWLDVVLIPSFFGLAAVGGVHGGASSTTMLLAMSLSEGFIVTIVAWAALRLTKALLRWTGGHHAA